MYLCTSTIASGTAAYCLPPYTAGVGNMVLSKREIFMPNYNDPVPRPEGNDGGIENRDEPTRQAPGYNEMGRGEDDSDGEANQIEPAWRPGDEPAGAPAGTGMQGEGEPGRAQRDSTGGVEGTPSGD